MANKIVGCKVKNFSFLEMMRYCPPNVTLGEVWVDHGISQCFMETVSAIIIGGFLMVFGAIQIVMYKRYVGFFCKSFKNMSKNIKSLCEICPKMVKRTATG